MMPGLSTLADAATLVTGKNYVTGESEGVGGRLIAAAGLFTPASGGELRGIGRVAKLLTERFGDEVATIVKTSSGAVQREWVNAKSGMKHVLRGPEVDQIRHGGPKVEHWNYEQHVPYGEGRWKKINNVHLDQNGNPIK